ncbi:hypothetical protein [Adhaeribacter aquaticus]|uniref:hypothetical protein n=1 Tax=Adhaeribacter aquaticus TaxID=299567 RepID=UPI00042522A0|nr:hypothetical protein [Adhaeribacter aquaticus]
MISIDEYKKAAKFLEILKNAAPDTLEAAILKASTKTVAQFYQENFCNERYALLKESVLR